MSRNRMKIRQYRERCGVLADLGELLQEISELGAPSDAEAKRDDQGDRHQKSAQARSTLAETSSYNSSVCGPAIRPPVTYENGGRNTGSVKPKFGAASLTDNGTRNRMEGCPNTVSPRMTEPTLCKRGSFRQDYAGSTFRDHYGSTRPVNVFSRSLQAIASSIEDRSRRARRAPCFAPRASSLCARLLTAASQPSSRTNSHR